MQPPQNASSGGSRFIIRPAARPALRVPLSDLTIFLSAERLLCKGDDEHHGHETGLLWDATAGKAKRILEGYGRPSAVAVTPDGDWVLTGYSETHLTLWDLRAAKLPGLWEKRVVHPARNLEDHTDWIFCCALSDDGTRALSGAADQTMRLWDTRTGKSLRVFEGHTDTVWSVALSADGAHALSGSRDMSLRLWDVRTGECLRVMQGHASAVGPILFSPDGAKALSGCGDETVRLWDLRSGQCLLDMGDSVQGGIQGLTQIAPQTDWLTCISVAAITGTRLWDLRSGEELCRLGADHRVDSVHAPVIPGLIHVASAGDLHFYECR